MTHHRAVSWREWRLLETRARSCDSQLEPESADAGKKNKTVTLLLDTSVHTFKNESSTVAHEFD